MEKCIKLSGRIDSTNALDIENNINNEIGDSDEEIIIDAKELEYISSAGLRIILRLKKNKDKIKIINCSSDVYDIFSMTGFTEIIDIVKKYREISVENCEIIGEGSNGIVYRISPDTIVKVYKRANSLEEINREIELARKAFVMQIPTAISYDVVRVGDLYGTVFELLNAKSYSELIREGISIKQLVEESVKVLKQIHKTNAKLVDLPNIKDEAIKWAEYSKQFLPQETGENLIKLFEKIPETDTIIHGDFQVKNIMKQNDETILIDMETLSKGHPIFELAAIYATYKGFSCVDEENSSKFLGITTKQCEEFLDGTFKEYFINETDEYIEKIMQKVKLICYTRIYQKKIRDNKPMDEEKKQTIEFCKNYIINNISKIDSLYF